MQVDSTKFKDVFAKGPVIASSIRSADPMAEKSERHGHASWTFFCAQIVLRRFPYIAAKFLHSQMQNELSSGGLTHRRHIHYGKMQPELFRLISSSGLALHVGYSNKQVVMYS
jgi:hypothetical protein